SRSEMHRSCVATDKQFRRFTQSNEFLERGRDVAQTFICRSKHVLNEMVFIRPASCDHLKSVGNKAARQLAVTLGFPTLSAPVPAGIDENEIGKPGKLLFNGSPGAVAWIQRN